MVAELGWYDDYGVMTLHEERVSLICAIYGGKEAGGNNGSNNGRRADTSKNIEIRQVDWGRPAGVALAMGRGDGTRDFAY